MNSYFDAEEASMAALRTLFETPTDVRMTAAEYIDNPLSEQKSDLIEGVFVMASPASFQHEDLQSFLITSLSNFVEFKQLGKVMGPNTAYRLSEENVFQPDVSFISRERLHLAEKVYFPGPPDIAVEITSPSSRQYDEIEKKINYGRYGVKEYWLIDLLSSRATFYTQQEGQLIPIRTEAGLLRSDLLDGYWLKLEWLFPPEAVARPTALEIARLQGLI
jgi:Uma2 family endonuclease